MFNHSHEWLSHCFCSGSMHFLFISCHLCLCCSQLFFGSGGGPCIWLVQLGLLPTPLFEKFSHYSADFHNPCLAISVCCLYSLCRCWKYSSPTTSSEPWVPVWEGLALKCLLHWGDGYFETSCILEGWEHCWVHPSYFFSVIQCEFNSITHSANIYWALNCMSDTASETENIALNQTERYPCLSTNCRYK